MIPPLRICVANPDFYRSSGVTIAIKRAALPLLDEPGLVKTSLAEPDVEMYFAGCRSDTAGLEEDLDWIPPGRLLHFDLMCTQATRLTGQMVRFARWARATGIAIVHVHHRRLAALLRLLEPLGGFRVLYTAALAYPEAAWFRRLCPPRTTAVTPSVARNVKETTGHTVLACISNPVPFPATLPPPALGQLPRRAVCVGRLDPVKGHRHLLRAWALLRQRGLDVHLDLVGEGQLESTLRAQAADAGIADCVHFHGFAPDIAPFLAQALFAILVSEVEGQGMVTVEAAAAGRASLLTAVPGSIDLLPIGRTLPNGVAFGDAEGLANALARWFESPAEVAAEGQRFYDFLKSGSDSPYVAGEYLALYRKIAAE